jgi:uncharacterized membrane protein
MDEPPPPTEPNLAHIAALDYDLAKADLLERLRFQASFAEIAWKSLTLINGGAIVSLLTFIGHENSNLNANSLWNAFAAFCLGLAFCVASILAGFLAQAYFMKSTISNAWNLKAEMHGHEPRYTAEAFRQLRTGNIFEVIAIAVNVLSFLAFVVGAGFSVSAISVGGKNAPAVQVSPKASAALAR